MQQPHALNRNMLSGLREHEGPQTDGRGLQGWLMDM